MVTYKVGDKVEWTSQSSGYVKHKRGEVVKVLPVGERPFGMPRSRVPGMARDHESYVIKVPRAGLYWPRVSALKPAE